MLVRPKTSALECPTLPLTFLPPRLR